MACLQLQSAACTQKPADRQRSQAPLPACQSVRRLHLSMKRSTAVVRAVRLVHRSSAVAVKTVRGTGAWRAARQRHTAEPCLVAVLLTRSDGTTQIGRRRTRAGTQQLALATTTGVPGLTSSWWPTLHLLPCHPMRLSCRLQRVRSAVGQMAAYSTAIKPYAGGGNKRPLQQTSCQSTGAQIMLQHGSIWTWRAWRHLPRNPHRRRPCRNHLLLCLLQVASRLRSRAYGKVCSGALAMASPIPTVCPVTLLA
jgi:hypothetical protein